MLGRPGTLLSGDSGSGAALSLNFLGGTLPGQVSFTRASAANYFNNAGLLTSATINVPRFDYNPATLALNGLLIEQASTNSALWSRDLTNAAWTTLLGTAAKDQTGIDGVANSASSFVATSGNATTLQTVTHVSSTDNYAVWLKRITGTGEIDITLDGGVTWTNVTSQINSSTWTRVSANESTVINPAVGLRIVTNGDKIAVDQNQLEIGQNFATSDIITTSTAAPRSADVASIATTSFAWSAAAGAAMVKLIGLNAAGTPRTLGTNAASNALALLFGLTSAGFFDGASVTISVGSGSLGVVNKQGSSWGPSRSAVAFNGSSVVDGGVPNAANMAQITTLMIGAAGAGSSYGNGWYQAVQIFNRQPSDGQLQALTH